MVTDFQEFIESLNHREEPTEEEKRRRRRARAILMSMVNSSVPSPTEFTFTAPVLAFVSATDPDSDNTQDLEADFSEDIEGYVVRLVGTFGSATVSEPYDVDSSNTIDAGEAAALEAAFTTGAIDDGLCSFKCRIENGSGVALSAWSNTVGKTITAATSAGEAIGLLLTLTKAA